MKALLLGCWCALAATGGAVTASRLPAADAVDPQAVWIEHPLIAVPVVEGGEVRALRFVRIGSGWREEVGPRAGQLRRAAVAQAVTSELLAPGGPSQRIADVAKTAGKRLARFGLAPPESVLLLQSVLRERETLRAPTDRAVGGQSAARR